MGYRRPDFVIGPGERESLNGFLSLWPLASSLVFVQGSIEFTNEAHQFFWVAFIAGLFGQVVPIGLSARGHSGFPLLLLNTLRRMRNRV
jgi:hypothetical protein